MLCNLRPKRAYYVSYTPLGSRVIVASLIAVLGALVTIMVSLTDSFAQKLLQFEICSQRNDTTLVTVAKTNLSNASRMEIAPGLYDEYNPLAVAVNVGLIQLVRDQISVFSRGCSSGDCSFSSTDGVSFLSSHGCEDVTTYMNNLSITNEHNEIVPVITVGNQEKKIDATFVPHA
ncbi:uncharacterized protein CC84DRAFT_1097582 [Paraphaeosphaeria sporulosa]|uniref:Uncharacterized protein n=1 Tax=Paraphaeosphaeria sporulosa TaxID=1460663 RepID=A0A177C6B9_9PLEO|nr:uncharacterized protein CC84DRAFT_1097582 [Paraphaeosphaeria sporulosa]OAG03075.1 hypothetical protein CC84DRAFT_1097582 [Paraphaeosphaeria sporulosa]